MTTATLFVCLLAAVVVQDAHAPLAAARSARDEGRLDDAITIYRGLLGTADDADAREGLAVTLSWAGRLPESLAAYRDLAERVPTRELPARRGAVRVLGWAGRYDEARAEAKSLLDRWPEDEEARLLAAQIEGWAGRYDEAARLYGQIIESNPALVEARVGLAYVHVWGGRPAEAAAALDGIAPAARSRRDVRLVQAAVDQGRADRIAYWRDLQELRHDFPADRDVRRLDRRDRGERGPHLRLDVDGGSDTDDLDRRGGALRGAWPVSAVGHVFAEGRADRFEAADLAGVTVQTLRAGVDLAPARGLGARASAGYRWAPDERGGGVAGLALSLEPSPRFAVGASFDHDFAYYTVASVARDVRQTAFDLSAAWSPAPRVSLRGAYSRTRFAPALGDDQHRDAWFLAVRTLTLEQPFRLDLGGRVRVFRFDRSLPGVGYFNPERYRQAVATATATWRRGERWTVVLDGSLGAQQVETDTAWDIAGGASLEATHALGRRWDVQVGAGYSHLSLTTGNYSETTVRASLLWRLPVD
jgi:tetratricopeptide (TPR) repeat protein